MLSVVGADCGFPCIGGRGLLRLSLRRGPPHTLAQDFLILVLQLIELVVDAMVGQEFLVCAHFAKLAFVHDQNLVGALDGAR